MDNECTKSRMEAVGEWGRLIAWKGDGGWGGEWAMDALEGGWRLGGKIVSRCPERWATAERTCG